MRFNQCSFVEIYFLIKVKQCFFLRTFSSFVMLCSKGPETNGTMLEGNDKKIDIKLLVHISKLCKYAEFFASGSNVFPLISNVPQIRASF